MKEDFTDKVAGDIVYDTSGKPCKVLRNEKDQSSYPLVVEMGAGAVKCLTRNGKASEICEVAVVFLNPPGTVNEEGSTLENFSTDELKNELARRKSTPPTLLQYPNYDPLKLAMQEYIHTIQKGSFKSAIDHRIIIGETAVSCFYGSKFRTWKNKLRPKEPRP
jgi:hypothetical protein